MATEEPSQEAMVFFLGHGMAIDTTANRTKGFRPSVLVRILFPLFHLLPERLSLLLIHERQAREAVLEFAM